MTWDWEAQSWWAARRTSSKSRWFTAHSIDTELFVRLLARYKKNRRKGNKPSACSFYLLPPPLYPYPFRKNRHGHAQKSSCAKRQTNLSQTIFKSQENGIRISGECNYTIIQIVIKKLYFDKKAPAFHVWDKRNTVSDIHGKGQLAPFHSKLAFMPLPFSGFSIPGEAHANTIF